MPIITVRSREEFREHLERRYAELRGKSNRFSHPERAAKAKGTAGGMAEALIALEQWEAHDIKVTPEQEQFLMRCLQSRAVLDSTLVTYNVSFLEACEFWGIEQTSNLRKANVSDRLKDFRVMLAECNLIITRQDDDEIILSNRRSVNLNDIDRISNVDKMLRVTFERMILMLSRRRT